MTKTLDQFLRTAQTTHPNAFNETLTVETLFADYASASDWLYALHGSNPLYLQYERILDARVIGMLQGGLADGSALLVENQVNTSGDRLYLNCMLRWNALAEEFFPENKLPIAPALVRQLANKVEHLGNDDLRRLLSASYLDVSDKVRCLTRKLDELHKISSQSQTFNNELISPAMLNHPHFGLPAVLWIAMCWDSAADEMDLDFYRKLKPFLVSRQTPAATVTEFLADTSPQLAAVWPLIKQFEYSYLEAFTMLDGPGACKPQTFQQPHDIAEPLR